MPSIHRLRVPTTALPQGDESAAPEGLKMDRVGLGAVRRIFSPEAEPAAPMMGRGRGRRIRAGDIRGQALEIGASGRFLLGGRLASPHPGRGEDADLIHEVAKLAASGEGLFASVRMSSAMRGRVVGQLAEVIDEARTGRPSKRKDRALCGALTLLIDLARATPASDGTVRRAVLDTVLKTLHHEDDKEKIGFYLQSMRDLFKKLDKVQVAALKAILTRVLPKKPPVDAWTANRTKPLVMRHMIHQEFWKEELSYFSKKNGFKLVKKNSKDNLRIYEGLIKDPRGRKKPLKVEIEVRKGEIDFLDDMNDPNVHVLMYSGHSSLGGNGSEAVQSAPAAEGEHPKLVFVANCRGKDNYAEFTNKFPDAHVIMTEHATYGDSGQDRIRGLFDTLVRGNTYRYMRSETEYPWWDEPADNYFYPDEWRKFRFMDSDSDGKLDFTGLGSDRLFNVDARGAASKFVRAVNFANSELFYHWEVDHEQGKKSYFGKQYGDSLVPDGLIANPRTDEVVRVIPNRRASANGKKSTRFRVRFNPEIAQRTEQNVYAALVTMHTTLELARHARGSVNRSDLLRSVLMGAQAVHYMDVYEDSAMDNLAAFLARAGLPASVDPEAVDALFEAHDGHANAEQVSDLEALLKDHGVDLDAWFARAVPAAPAS